MRFISSRHSYRIITGLLVLSGLSGICQDIHFSQFNNTPLLINPALAGTAADIDATLNYKDQWRSVASPYKTFSASYAMKLSKKRWGYYGLGLTFMNDVAGDALMSNLSGLLSFSCSRKLNSNNVLGAGIQAGFHERSIIANELKWGSQYNGLNYDPSIPSGEAPPQDRFEYLDVSTGMYWNYGSEQMYISANDALRVHAGISVFHLNKPQQSFYVEGGDPLHPKLVAHGGLDFGIKNTSYALVPGFIFFKQGPAKEILAGSLFRYNIREDAKYTGYIKSASFSLGAYYRWSDALVLTSLLQISSLSIQVSYDVNVSSLRNASNGRGGVEIGIRFNNTNGYLYQGFKGM